MTAAGSARWHRADDGAGSVLALGVIAVLLSLAAGALAVVAAVHAGHRAAAGADLAALAAAAVLTGDPVSGAADPCREAHRVALANGGTLTSCRVSGEQVEVTVAVTPTCPGLPEALARARAEPAPGGH